MKKIIRNLLPQDTRSVEYPSSAGMMLTAILLFFDVSIREIHINVSNQDIFLIVLFLVGLIHFLILVTYPRLVCIRPLFSWAAGTFWLWLAFSQPLSILSMPTFLLGASNIASFLINTVIMSEKWRQ